MSKCYDIPRMSDKAETNITKLLWNLVQLSKTANNIKSIDDGVDIEIDIIVTCVKEYVNELLENEGLDNSEVVQ